ncbi:hypothetical protein JYU34_006465, partial [Plutella xylostella]
RIPHYEGAPAKTNKRQSDVTRMHLLASREWTRVDASSVDAGQSRRPLRKR